MKITHSYQHTRKSFELLSDIQEISQFVRDHYNPMTCDCKEIANMFAIKYSNISVVPASVMIFNGTFQVSSHTVCLIDSTDYLIDLTGDYTDYYNLAKLRHAIQPWIYKKQDNIYISLNHLPVILGYDEKLDPDAPLNEFDLVKMTGGPFFKNLRAISI